MSSRHGSYVYFIKTITKNRSFSRAGIFVVILQASASAEDCGLCIGLRISVLLVSFLSDILRVTVMFICFRKISKYITFVVVFLLLFEHIRQASTNVFVFS